MKQFENFNNTMESENHSKNMTNSKTLINRGFFLLLIVTTFAFSSCGPKLYLVKSNPKQNEVSVSPDLRQFLNTNKQQISVVLRTPRTSSYVAQEVQNGELYNTIERKLMNAGFAVRDRALLEKLVIFCKENKKK